MTSDALANDDAHVHDTDDTDDTDRTADVADGMLSDDLLLEEISIDGMCGVY